LIAATIRVKEATRLDSHLEGTYSYLLIVSKISYALKKYSIYFRYKECKSTSFCWLTTIFMYKLQKFSLLFHV
jgi:hypothetical protein